MTVHNLSKSSLQPGNLSAPDENNLPTADSRLNVVQANDAAMAHLTDRLDNSFLVAGSLKPAELGWAVASPARALFGRQAADRATERANSVFAQIDPGRVHSPDDNEQNAFKHAFWNALMVKDFAVYELDHGTDLNTRLLNGAGWARRFADAHEQDLPFAPANTQEQHEMDFYNNRVGREIAIRVLRENPNASETDLSNAVMDALRGGELSVLKREYPRPF